MKVSIVNSTTELRDCRDAWFFDQDHHCWCLEDILYTSCARVPKFQRMSIYAPESLMAPGGVVLDKKAPVVFHNNAAGYMQMPHAWLESSLSRADQYLAEGFVYVTCGCRGRESRDSEGRLAGKSPATLIDLKTAIRFLRHNREAVPGDLDKIISVGVSAGGAMSSLLAVTGDHPDYVPLLRENGAFLDESDRVFASQIYCPIIDLGHADQAYEWMFHQDKTCEDSHAGPAQTMTPFQDALSRELADQYIHYFNALQLKDPATGTLLRLGEDGRSGSGYKYLMNLLDASATKHLTLMAQGKLSCTPEDYIAGNHLRMVPEPPRNRDAHHAGPGVDVPEVSVSLGDLLSRPANGQSISALEPRLIPQPGMDKHSWLSWDGAKAHISDLDTYILNHRRRMKPCTSFDVLAMNSGENQVFGTPDRDYVHYNAPIALAIERLKDRFPEEYALYHHAYAAAAEDPDLPRRMQLIDPMGFIADPRSTPAQHCRIRVGAQDADTATTISMALALKLVEAGRSTVDYALVWDQPHCDADYPGEVCQWIHEICDC